MRRSQQNFLPDVVVPIISIAIRTMNHYYQNQVSLP